MMTMNPLMHRREWEYQCGWFRVFDAFNTLRVFEKNNQEWKIKELPILWVQKPSSESNLNCQVQVFENPNQITVWFYERTGKRTQQFFSDYIWIFFSNKVQNHGYIYYNRVFFLKNYHCDYGSETGYLIFYLITCIKFDTHLDTQHVFGAISDTHPASLWPLTSSSSFSGGNNTNDWYVKFWMNF